jgi:type IV pilus assembly protein PilN
MYSLDINLLSERPEYQTGKQPRSSGGSTIAIKPQYGKIPLYIGAGIAVVAMVATGAGWVLLGQQTSQMEAKQQDLDLKLGSLKAQDARLASLNAETTQITGETKALAGIFNQVQPWSAVLQDLRESIPQGVQIGIITQTEKSNAPKVTAAANAKPSSGSKLIDKINDVPNPEASLAPGASPVAATPGSTPPSVPTTTLPSDIPTTKLDIAGTAKTFEEVNNFMLTLKRSAFFNPDDTQLLSATLAAGGKLEEVVKDSKSKEIATTKLELPKIVEYKIQTSLKRIPANDLIGELERKGAVGLVTRLRTLQQQEVLKP